MNWQIERKQIYINLRQHFKLDIEKLEIIFVKRPMRSLNFSFYEILISVTFSPEKYFHQPCHVICVTSTLSCVLDCGNCMCIVGDNFCFLRLDGNWLLYECTKILYTILNNFCQCKKPHLLKNYRTKNLCCDVVAIKRTTITKAIADSKQAELLNQGKLDSSEVNSVMLHSY